ncbi:uncharacterized protein N7515_002657 [Penicillium bovifimosum]|uniref:Uncharacterized protein n=1 Tax=Penicillium bovifimosum TaxID=126998 RepID=A0A9W9HBX9_9EURO|nr:uncharacterized protein N7515_002657 [Penicillium bovifimosum]KAJ5143870.1 hypothetical protein N7515_002657 [Penicillium bovifimosum]
MKFYPHVFSRNTRNTQDTQDTQDERISPRGAAAKCFELVWGARLSDSPELIEPADHSKLHIQCSDLDEDTLATESQFFRPAGDGEIPLPYSGDDKTKARLEQYKRWRKLFRENRTADLAGQAGQLAYIISTMFDYISRNTKKTVYGSHPSLRDPFPEAIRTEFADFFPDPYALERAYAYNEGSLGGKVKRSHTLIVLAVSQPPDDRLSTLEVLAIILVTITRLNSDELPSVTKTVPVMVISSFQNMKARVLIAYLASEQLIIQKTPLLDFADETAADVNTTLLMRYMASEATGDTKGIGISTNPPPPPPTVRHVRHQKLRELANSLQSTEPTPRAAGTWKNLTLRLRR